jgi:hypothetical protein
MIPTRSKFKFDSFLEAPAGFAWPVSVISCAKRLEITLEFHDYGCQSAVSTDTASLTLFLPSFWRVDGARRHGPRLRRGRDIRDSGVPETEEADLAALAGLNHLADAKKRLNP